MLNTVFFVAQAGGSVHGTERAKLWMKTNMCQRCGAKTIKSFALKNKPEY